MLLKNRYIRNEKSSNQTAINNELYSLICSIYIYVFISIQSRAENHRRVGRAHVDPWQCQPEACREECFEKQQD